MILIEEISKRKIDNCTSTLKNHLFRNLFFRLTFFRFSIVEMLNSKKLISTIFRVNCSMRTKFVSLTSSFEITEFWYRIILLWEWLELKLLWKWIVWLKDWTMLLLWIVVSKSVNVALKCWTKMSWTWAWAWNRETFVSLWKLWWSLISKKAIESWYESAKLLVNENSNDVEIFTLMLFAFWLTSRIEYRKTLKIVLLFEFLIVQSCWRFKLLMLKIWTMKECWWSKLRFFFWTNVLL